MIAAPRPQEPASAPIPKFASLRGTLSCELRNQRSTSKFMILVPLFDLKFLNEPAATAVGTSNRRHWPGPDLRPVVSGDLSTVVYGMLPPGFMAVLRERLVQRRRAKLA